jgi:hypothetical protein
VVPEVRYARSGDVSIAYQIIGDGPFDLVWTPGALSHLELRWADEGVNRFYRGALLLLPPDRLRQARDRALRPGGRDRRPRDTDGRHPRGNGRRGERVGRDLRGLGGRTDGAASRRHLSRARAGARRDAVTDLGLEVRAGLHTGECEVLDGKVAGIALSIGARVAAQAWPGEVPPLPDVRDLLAGSGIEFVDRGGAELKGVPGEWQLYAVAAA